MPMRFLVIIFFLTVQSQLSHAGFQMTPGCSQAYREICRLNFNKARLLLEAEKKSNPSNFMPRYVESYMDFLHAFISEEEPVFNSLKKKRTEKLDQLESEDEQSPWYRMIKAELYLQTAIVKIKFQEYLTAAYEFRRAYKLLEENNKKFPGFIPNKKCLGVLHALIGAVPPNYRWLANLLGFRGSIEQGLGELNDLNRIASSNSDYEYLGDESLIMLMFFESHLLKNNQSAVKRAEQIESKNPGPLHLFAILSIYLYAANNEKALALLSSRENTDNGFRFCYLDYMNGLALLNKLDTNAGTFFSSYLDQFSGRSFIKSAYQKLAWISLIKNDTAGYFRFMNLVLTRGNDFTDEDKQALKEAKTKSLPNIWLLRSRLLFDGGYYHDALAQLAGKPVTLFPALSDQLEFTYRIARIYDKTEQDEKAVRYYEKTVANGESHPYYFAANSALYLGLYYENKQDRERAIQWYRKCLSLRNHEYQNSIDQKAQAGLNRLHADR